MIRYVYMRSPDARPDVLVREEEAEPTCDDTCIMCGTCLACSRPDVLAAGGGCSIRDDFCGHRWETDIGTLPPTPKPFTVAAGFDILHASEDRGWRWCVYASHCAAFRFYVCTLWRDGDPATGRAPNRVPFTGATLAAAVEKATAWVATR